MKAESELSVLVEGAGLPEVQEIHLKVGSKVREIASAVAVKCGFAPEEALLFVEDEDEPLALDLVVDEKYDRKRIHHVHRARKIEVVVFYENREKKREFSPSTRVSRVLAWAVGREGFNIDPSIAPEMRLQLFGHREPLPNEAHIGRFVPHHEHVLKLNLIRGIIPNGRYGA